MVNERDTLAKRTGGIDETLLPVQYADDGTPIYFDVERQQFYVTDPQRAHQGGREYIQPGDERLRQAFGKAIPTPASTGPSATALLASADRARELAQQAKQFDQEFAYQVAQDDELLRWNMAKERAAIAEGNKDRELRAHSLIENITARIEQTKLARRQMMLDTASEIGRLAQNPADAGRLAGFLRAGLSLSELMNTGQNAITDESAAPIQALLQSQQDLANAPVERAPTLAELFQPIDPEGFFEGVANAALPGGETDATAPEGDRVVAANPRAPMNSVGGAIPVPGAPDAIGNITDLISGAFSGRRAPFTEDIDPNLGDQGAPRFPSIGEEIARFLGTPALADGGTTSAPAAIVGEAGPELMTRNPDGSVTITPFDDIPGMQDGGTFEGFGGFNPFRYDPSRQPIPGPQAQQPKTPGPVTVQDARDFIQGVGNTALQRGGFGSAADASPLKVAAPGTSNFLRQLSASTAGALGFGPPDLFFDELAKLIPIGAPERSVGRTR